MTVDRAFSVLSLTALAIDVLVVFLLLSVFADSASMAPHLRQWGISSGLLSLLALPIGLALHYLLVEIVFSGRSIGRLCTGLNYIQADTGATASLGARLQRFSATLARLGTGTLSLSTRPSSDRRMPCTLTSDWIGVLAPDPAKHNTSIQSPVKAPGSGTLTTARQTASLLVTHGPSKGTSSSLSVAIKGEGNGVFVIGRDPQKSHLLLISDPSVSRIQCRIALRNGQYILVDGAASTEPSAYGTKLDGRQVAPAPAAVIKDGSTIEIGQNRIVFRLGA